MSRQMANIAAATGQARDDVLLEALARARRSPFYAQRLAGRRIESRADFAQLPLTLKTDVRDASPFGLLIVPPTKAWHYHESSGTTGEPVSTWVGLAETQTMGQFVRRMVPELSTESLLLNRFPLFAPVSFVFEEAMRAANGCHIPAGTMSWDVPFERAVDFIKRLNVTALSSLPLEPILLCEAARERGIDPKRDLTSLRVVFCGGAVLPPSLRRAIEQDWGARVVEIYGSNETMLLGVGCTAGRLHLCTEFHELEVLHPDTHVPVPPGEPGILTATGLIHTAMPLIRYFTGDLVRLGTAPCTCGLDGPTAEVLGRYDDVIAIGGGQTSHYAVLDAAYEFGDRLGTRIFFVLVRRRGLHLLMEVANPQSARDPEGERRLAERVGVPVTVEYLGHNEVLDRSAMFRGPKIYKPSVISDWRAAGRKTITIMEALLEWPSFDLRTLMHIGRRQWRNARRRRRLVREDRG